MTAKRDFDDFRDDIVADLNTFRTPGTTVDAARTGEHLTVKWSQGRAIRQAKFRLNRDGGREVQCKGQQWIPYRSFLASEIMADLPHLAQMILTTDKDDPRYVDPHAIESDTPEGSKNQKELLTLLGQLSAEPSQFATRLVFIRGEAGGGKTMAMRKLVREQARAFEKGASDWLYFYVNAQGRALSRLNEALAAEIQDLGLQSVNYHSIATLVRNELLSLVIDGFDELIGAGGYAEAFSSISSFLATLHGQGTIIATGRSTFYSHQKLNEMADRFSGSQSLNYRVRTVTLLPWDETQVKEYVEKCEVSSGAARKVWPDISSLLAQWKTQNTSLLQKPFYIAKLVEIHQRDGKLEADQHLMPQIIDHFIHREATKWSAKSGETLLTVPGHYKLLTELAGEMWWLESRRLDEESLLTLAEMVVTDLGLAPEQVRNVLGKVPSYALLRIEQEALQKFWCFEHEMYFGFFLSRRLEEMVRGTSGELKRFLRRSLLEEAVTEQFGRDLAPSKDPDLLGAIGGICSASGSGREDWLARQNAGLLLAALASVRRRMPAGGKVFLCDFDGAKFGKVEFVKTVFDACSFQRVSLLGSSITDCSFTDCTFHTLVVGRDSPNLKGSTFSESCSIYSLAIQLDDKVDVLYDPRRIAEVLASLGGTLEGRDDTGERPKQYTTKQQSLIQLLTRFLRYAERSYYIDLDDSNAKQLFSAYDWPTLRKMLEQHGLLYWEKRDKRGPNPVLGRLTKPPQLIREAENPIIRRRDDQVAAFWGELLDE